MRGYFSISAFQYYRISALVAGKHHTPAAIVNGRMETDGTIRVSTNSPRQRHD